jgi:Ni/Fe-hydrogenase subunit HybB-like protein
MFILVIGLAAGGYGAFQVFTRGLVVTNLTDLVPWGLWITIDLSSIALSAGAFLLCAAVHILGLKRFQPVARTATFIGLTGYSMAMLTLLLDIGRPQLFWHAWLYWNPHSLLWEVTMCITLYFTVLALETLPIIGEAEWFSKRFPKLATQMVKAHHLAPFLAIVGLCLSMLHQSSLGATYGVLKAHPIWYRPDLSVLFMVSAMAAGPAMTVLISMVSARISSRAHVDDNLLEKLSFFIGWVMVAYLYFRFWDALAMTYTYQPGKTEGLGFITQGPLSFNFWAGEIILGAVIPIILLVIPRFRRVAGLRMLALALIVGGLVAYRFDTNLAGELVQLSYLPNGIVARYTSYFPSLIEFLAGLGVVSFGALVITLGVRYLHVVDHRVSVEAHEQVPETATQPAAAD